MAYRSVFFLWMSLGGVVASGCGADDDDDDQVSADGDADSDADSDGDADADGDADGDGDGDSDADADGDADADADADGDADADADGDADAELCNGLDDDGDGDIDEGDPGSGAFCQTDLQGACAVGQVHCVEGAPGCVPIVAPQEETCANNGNDDDCNGVNDDIGGLDGECETGLFGVCGIGRVFCDGAEMGCEVTRGASDEICANGRDENCDGRNDEQPCVNRTIVMLCGDSGRDIAGLLPDGFELQRSCNPDDTTQAVLISRNGVVNANRLRTFVEDGGVVITEFSNSHTIFNTVFEENVAQGSRQGQCSDDPMPAVQLNPGDPFWQDNAFAPPAQSGCGYDVSLFPEITPLGGWGNGTVSLAYREKDSGRLWLLEADWQDGAPIGQASIAMMRYMIGFRPIRELCNGIDDDDDGEIDEGGDRCRTGQIGACGVGATACDEGGLIVCLQQFVPEQETCANIGDDNDCNGVEDDCNTGLLGICGAGTTTCGNGNETVCTQDNQRGAEICLGGSDEDCDGEVDEAECVNLLCSELATQHCEDRGWSVGGAAQGGNLVCTIDGRASNNNCDTCATYNIYVWEDGSQERHCPGVYSTEAGGMYSAHTPCQCGDNLDLCDNWQADCIPD